MTNIAVLLFNVVRFHLFAWTGIGDSLGDFLSLEPVIGGQVVLPLAMLLIYYLSGYYYTVSYRSRMEDLVNTALTTFVGALVVYFAVILNDPDDDRGAIYEIVGILWGIMFGCVYPVRLILTLTVVKRMHNRKFGYDTLIVGTSQSAVKLAKRLNESRRSMGFNIVGYVNIKKGGVEVDDFDLPVYSLEQLEDVVARKNIKRLIVSQHPNGFVSTMDLINKLFPLGLPILTTPTIFHLISGRMAFGNVAGEPLVDVSNPAISPMTACVKRFSDIVVSTIALVVLSPVMLSIALWVKLDSKGPVIYRQERVGYKKRPFDILKFRSMRADAEEAGPSLSNVDDPRVTRAGRVLRKYRLDELPQFWNVIKGEMSIVGPRPERAYYVNQIVARAPYYSLIHQVRPGITSWGMVKYGYATTVDEMIERLNYDLIYLENVSVGVDLKIIFYTINTVVTGRGV